ncbi:MAG: sugar phosphate nucleotidyltransferase, partial [Acidobacteriota bacterium]
SALADAGITEVALIVAPDHARLRQRYGADAPPSRVAVSFVVQPDALGTANAVLAAEAWTAGEPFLAMNADNLYPVPALRDLTALDTPGLPAFEADDLVRSGNIPADRIRAFALVQVDARGFLTGIVEKPGRDAFAAPEHAGQPPRLVSMNCWRFDARIFPACRDVPRSARGEFELPEAVGLAVRRGVPFAVRRARGPVLDLSTRADAAEVAARLAGAAPCP